MKSLVETLVERQQRMDLSDRAFAARLGVSRSTWTRVRLGDRRPGERLLSGVMRAFPSLTEDCLVYLRDGVSMPENVTQSDAEPVTEVA